MTQTSMELEAAFVSMDTIKMLHQQPEHAENAILDVFFVLIIQAKFVPLVTRLTTGNSIRPLTVVIALNTLIPLQIHALMPPVEMVF